MDEAREERYHTKISYIIANMKELPFEPQNEFEKKGIFYSLQTSIESLIDIIAMLVKDLGIKVKDDASNIEIIVKKRKLDQELGQKLTKANGMRNIIVNRYNGIDEGLILDSVEEVKQLLFDWLEIVEEILDEVVKNEGNT